MRSREFSKIGIDVQKIISKKELIPDPIDANDVFECVLSSEQEVLLRRLECFDVPNKNHDASIQNLPTVTVEFLSLSCTVGTSENPSRAGGRTFSLREVSRAGYLFCFVLQSAIAIDLHETRSWPSGQHCTGQKPTKDPQYEWL
jgi:hypothetical protein